MRFKEGDKVRIIKNVDRDNPFYDKYSGQVHKVLAVGRNTYKLDTPRPTGELTSWGWKEEELVPFEKTLDNLEVGDKVIDPEDREHYVLGICGEVIFITYFDNRDADAESWSLRCMKSRGWKVKDTPTEEVKELTIDEIAEKFELDPSKIRIKKEV